ncbi:MAG: T9SS type A sorting domain-containing protein [Bacteroidetes bacterium]|nr:T9SS type A sorting domain-containing protein [Bacteroidota bacterium]MCL1968764.1 T9SS type A sorting domain-containing protein [Bacteroidota bacterium]
MDMSGRLIYQSTITDTETVITLRVSKAIYNVKLILQDNKTTVWKLFVNGER